MSGPAIVAWIVAILALIASVSRGSDAMATVIWCVLVWLAAYAIAYAVRALTRPPRGAV